VTAAALRVVWASVAGVDVVSRFWFDATVYDMLARSLAAGHGFVWYPSDLFYAASR
jgi:hypothetical protein